MLHCIQRRELEAETREYIGLGVNFSQMKASRRFIVCGKTGRKDGEIEVLASRASILLETFIR